MLHHLPLLQSKDQWVHLGIPLARTDGVQNGGLLALCLGVHAPLHFGFLSFFHDLL